MRRWLPLLALVAGCAGPPAADPRASQLAHFWARATLPLARSRPHQLRLRFDEMARTPFRFLRGSEILFTRDLRDPTLPFARTALPPVEPILLQGDAHLENIGTFLGPRLDLNDFDAAGFGPPWWEVRRAAASLLVALREQNPGALDERTAARQLARAYADAILIEGPTPFDPIQAGAILQRRLRSAAKDGPARGELRDFTELSAGIRKLRRGNTDPSDPREALLDAPLAVQDDLAGALDRYAGVRQGAPWSAGYLGVKDVARRCGQGVGSLTAVRYYVLVEGPTASQEDDVLLQLKEATDASLDADLPYGARQQSAAERSEERQRRLQSSPEADPHLGHTRLLDLPMVVSTISDHQKTLRVGDLEGRSAAEIKELAANFGSLLGRLHARSVTLGGAYALESLRRWLSGQEERFTEETAVAAQSYADQVIQDHRRFLGLRAELGPLLGLPQGSPSDTPFNPAARAVLDPPCP